MSDERLRELARQAGISPSWRDVHGAVHEVGVPTLRAVLEALGLPAGSSSGLNESFGRIGTRSAGLPPLLTAEAGQPIRLDAPPGRYRLTLEDGTSVDGSADGGGTIPGIGTPGYHRFEAGGQATTVAVAPKRCFGLADAAPGQRPWGLAVQLYGLRRPGDGGLGDFGALREFVRSAGRAGAAAVAISPVHAQFSADPNRYSPYSPSSRMLLNVLHAEIDLDGSAAHALESEELVDWPRAARLRLDRMQALFEAADAPTLAAFAAFRSERGDALETHARFEALHDHLFGADLSLWHWRGWPAQYRDPAAPEVAQFAAAHAHDVARHAFMQFLADRSLGDAQHAARAAGMPIGLVADLAVGADSGGSHCWSRQAETLLGLTIGAPPDLLSPEGQSWGLAAFSPAGLARHGFGAYLEMLRAAMRHAGGVRIDHVMGLARLWVVPDGASAAEGAYLSFPQQDLLRLTALESMRHRAIVLGEDLGTLPDGFHETLQEAGILGMRILWFERRDQRFLPPMWWTGGAVAMTSTHDLPTVAGWWAGRDLAWRDRLGLGAEHGDAALAHRQQDRTELWAAFRDSGAADGELPAPDQGAPVADAALRHLAMAASDLVIVPVEDAFGLAEQPNLPGTLDQHPNWRRRLPLAAATALDDPAAAARLARLDAVRRTP